MTIWSGFLSAVLGYDSDGNNESRLEENQVIGQETGADEKESKSNEDVYEIMVMHEATSDGKLQEFDCECCDLLCRNLSRQELSDQNDMADDTTNETLHANQLPELPFEYDCFKSHLVFFDGDLTACTSDDLMPERFDFGKGVVLISDLDLHFIEYLSRQNHVSALVYDNQDQISYQTLSFDQLFSQMHVIHHHDPHFCYLRHVLGFEGLYDWCGSDQGTNILFGGFKGSDIETHNRLLKIQSDSMIHHQYWYEY